MPAGTLPGIRVQNILSESYSFRREAGPTRECSPQDWMATEWGCEVLTRGTELLHLAHSLRQRIAPIMQTPPVKPKLPTCQALSGWEVTVSQGC